MAVVHDWLVNYAGSERVLEQLLWLLPTADLFSVVDFVPTADRDFLGGRRARTTFIQHLPFARSRYRSYLPLMPLAIEQLDLSGYDLVVSSSHAVAKGVLVGPDTVHVCYCHTPLRYAWELQHAYLRESGLTRGTRAWAARWMLHRLRLWDVRSATGVDAFAANSAFVARRIQKAYRRDAAVIYPPVDVDGFRPTQSERGDYYVTASRFVPYKRIPMIVSAFRDLPDRQLLVIGDGPQRRDVERVAGSNVRLLGHLPDAELQRYVAHARAFLFAAVEDFGIAPVEAQAAGTPVIAFAEGGVCETVPGLEAPQPCGVLYDQQSAASLAGAVRRFEAARERITPAACRSNALRFSTDRFREEMAAFVGASFAAQRARAPARA